MRKLILENTPARRSPHSLLAYFCYPIQASRPPALILTRCMRKLILENAPARRSPHSALYASTLPSVRGYTLARCQSSAARALFHFSYICLPLHFLSPLYAFHLPSVRGYTLARCLFSSARAPPFIFLLLIFLIVFFLPICLHYSLD